MFAVPPHMLCSPGIYGAPCGFTTIYAPGLPPPMYPCGAQCVRNLTHSLVRSRISAPLVPRNLANALIPIYLPFTTVAPGAGRLALRYPQ